MTAALSPVTTATPGLVAYQREAEAGALAPATVRAIAADTRLFAAWCSEHGLSSLPATAATMAAYLDACAAGGKSAATIRRYAATIAAHHRAAGYDSPTHDEHVRMVLRRIMRTLGTRQEQARAMTRELLDAVLTAIPPHDPRGPRDRSMLMAAYDAMARRSELAAMRAEDLTRADDGSGTILIRRSKTDQDGEGHLAYLAPDTMRALDAWLAGRAQGLIWGISDGQIARMVERRGLDAGIRRLSGHSARVGAAQDQAAAGCELPEIMQAGRWNSPRMPARYIEQQTAAKSASAKLAKKQGRI